MNRITPCIVSEPVFLPESYFITSKFAVHKPPRTTSAFVFTFPPARNLLFRVHSQRREANIEPKAKEILGLTYVLTPHLRTVFLFLATQLSLSGITPEWVQVWKSVWFWFARDILITTGVAIGSRRSRNADPSSHASSVVKCSNFSEASIRAIVSNCRFIC